MTLDAILKFLRREIRMCHICQPLLIRRRLDNGGYCTRRQLSLALLMQDESQIECYEKRLRDAPLAVLERRGVSFETSGIVRLEVGNLSPPIFVKVSFYPKTRSRSVLFQENFL